MLLRDEPDHRRLRQLVQQVFTAARVKDIEQRAQRICSEQIELMRSRRTVDFIREYALPLPLRIIGEMLGVSAGDMTEFRKVPAAILTVASSGPVRVLTNVPAMGRLRRFIEGLIVAKRESPADDLLSDLIGAENEGDRLTHDELMSMVLLLLIAGHETTVNLVASGMLALLEHPRQCAELRDDPSIADTAVEELLRFCSPVQHGVPRYATEDFSLHDHAIKTGDTVFLLLASANRDESVFDRPDHLDLRRKPNPHVAFGVGSHLCLGAPLARLEGRVAFTSLLRELPDLRLALPADRLSWRKSFAVRGMRRMLVEPGLA
jgi:cytochrome P450 PksS